MAAGSPNAYYNQSNWDSLATTITRNRKEALGRSGGESGIRTHGTVSRTLAFEASDFNHSSISPQGFFEPSGGPSAKAQPSVYQTLTRACYGWWIAGLTIDD